MSPTCHMFSDPGNGHRNLRSACANRPQNHSCTSFDSVQVFFHSYGITYNILQKPFKDSLKIIIIGSQHSQDGKLNIALHRRKAGAEGLCPLWFIHSNWQPSLAAFHFLKKRREDESSNCCAISTWDPSHSFSKPYQQTINSLHPSQGVRCNIHMANFQVHPAHHNDRLYNKRWTTLLPSSQAMAEPSRPSSRWP